MVSVSVVKAKIVDILKAVGVSTDVDNVRQNRHRGASSVGFRIRADYVKNADGSESWNDYESYYTLTEFVNAYRKFGLPSIVGRKITFPKNVNGEGFKHVMYEQ